MVNETPVPIAVPPVEVAYQLMVPAEVVAPSVTVPASQRDPGMVLSIVGRAFTVVAMPLLMAEQPPAFVTFTVTVLPLVRLAVVNVVLVPAIP